jgi:SAM-dependent methyltransferase
VSAPSSTFVAASGDGYEMQMGRWSRRLAEPFLDFAGLGDGERLLDAGCGTGNLAYAASRRCARLRVVGVDVSVPYVEHARRRGEDPRLAFEVADVCALPFDDASFDRVLSMLVLHFVPRAPQAIAEMVRVARPGATVGATVWDNRGGVVNGRIFWDTAAAMFPEGSTERARHFARPMTRPGELAGALAAAGLVGVEATELAIRMEFASFADYWAPFDGRDGPVAAWVGRLAPDARERLRDAVRDAYLDGDPDGPRSFAAIAWAAKGRVPA